jgi:multicomponent Na+:H+ antiporter subunit D
MVGIPPTAGFFSKWYLVLGSLDAGQWVLAVVIGTSSLLTAVYFLRLFERIFVVDPQEAVVADAQEPEPRIVGTVLVLASLLLVIGLGNAVLVGRVLEPIAVRLLG